VREVFTLCGGHISPILTGCEALGIRVFDTRHEVNAVFAADAVARLRQDIGVAAVTAGPGDRMQSFRILEIIFNNTVLHVLYILKIFLNNFYFPRRNHQQHHGHEKRSNGRVSPTFAWRRFTGPAERPRRSSGP
jgi:hypothetical protein